MYVPLETISSIVETAVGKVRKIERGISFETGCGHTNIVVTPVHYNTSDGLEVEAVLRVRGGIRQRCISCNPESI